MLSMLSRHGARRAASMITSVVLILSLLFPAVMAPSQMFPYVFADEGDTPQAVLTSEAVPLYVSELDGARLRIYLAGETFLPEANAAAFQLMNGPEGLSVADVVHEDESTVELILAYGGETGEEYPDFFILIDGSVLTGGSNLATNPLAIMVYDEGNGPGPELPDKLSNLILQGNILNADEWEFVYDQYTYTVYVEPDHFTITLIPQLFHPSAAVQVSLNGDELPLGAQGYTFDIDYGENVVTIDVTPPNETEWTQRYTIYFYMSATDDHTYYVDSVEDGADANPGDGLCRTEDNRCTLRAAIMEANHLQSDTMVTIILPAGTYVLTIAGDDEDSAETGDLDIIAPRLAIVGAGESETVIDGGGLDRVFDIWSVEFELSGVTITGGAANDGDGGSALYSNYALDESYYPMITVRDVLIVNNHSYGESETGEIGGAIVNIAGDLTLERVTFEGNTTVGMGGALFNWAVAKLTDVVIVDNSADLYGGAIANYGDLTVESSVIQSNTAGFNGAAIYNNDGSINVEHSEIMYNTVVSNPEGATFFFDSFEEQGYNASVLYNKILQNDTTYDIDNVSDEVHVFAHYNYWGEAGPGESRGSVTYMPYFLYESMRDNELSGRHEDLRDLLVSSGTLIPELSRWIDEYTLLLSEDTESVVITPVLWDPKSSVMINNEVSGHMQPYELSVPQGSTDLMITVTDTLGGSRTYNLTVERSMPSRTFYVNTTEDLEEGCIVEEGVCSLRAAIHQANQSNSHDVIVLEPGTYTLTKGELLIEQPVNIVGAGSDATIIEDSSSQVSPVFTITSREFHLSGLTLTGVVSDYSVVGFERYIPGGNYSMTDVVISGNESTIGNLITIYYGTLSLQDVVIRDNFSLIGTVYLDANAKLVASDVTFERNESFTYGGGIYNLGELDLTNVTFRQNRAASGGAIYNYGYMSVYGGTFEENAANASNNVYEGYGGAIYNHDYSTAVIEGSQFTGNIADTQGGGIYSAGHLEIETSKIQGNQANDGGGIYSSGVLVLGSSELYQNNALTGGGLYIEKCYFCEYEEDEYVNWITDSTFRSNRASYYGGAVMLEEHGIIVNSTFTHNEAGAAGAGIMALLGVVINHSTIADNMLGEGGFEAIYNNYGIELSEPTGSGLYVPAVSPIPDEWMMQFGESNLYRAYVANSIIYGSDDFTTVCEGHIKLLGRNIVKGGCGPMSAYDSPITDQDPLLGGLEDNGGYVKTRALLPGSPALDAALPVSLQEVKLPFPAEDLAAALSVILDARGYTRTAGKAADIGAFEVMKTPYAVLPYYNALTQEIKILFGSGLGLETDPAVAPLDPGKFTVTVYRNNTMVDPEITSLDYGEDGRSVVLAVSGIEFGDSIILSIDTNAVLFTDGVTYAHSMEELDVLTAWQVMLLLTGGNNSNPVDVGTILKALRENTLEELLDMYQLEFKDDPELIRMLLTLVQTKYVQ